MMTSEISSIAIDNTINPSGKLTIRGNGESFRTSSEFCFALFTYWNPTNRLNRLPLGFCRYDSENPARGDNAYCNLTQCIDK